MVKAVLVGCGAISREELRGLTSHPEVSVVGLVDLVPGNALARREEFHLDAETGADLAAMLVRHRPEIVVDCTPPAAHSSVACTAMRHGAHVLGQKPMADTLENARRAIEVSRETGLTYGVIQTGRFDEDARTLRELVSSGVIGEVKTIEFRYFTAMHFPQGDFRNTMRHVLLLDLAIHGFDAVRFITGRNAVNALCREWNPSSSWFGHDASAMAYFEMDEEVRFVYHGSWCAEGLIGRRWRIIGTRGSVAMENGVATAERVSGTGGFRSELQSVKVETAVLAESERSHVGAVFDFVDAIRERRPPLSPCTDNFNSLAMVHAAIASSESGREVAVESIES